MSEETPRDGLAPNQYDEARETSSTETDSERTDDEADDLGSLQLEQDIINHHYRTFRRMRQRMLDLDEAWCRDPMTTAAEHDASVSKLLTLWGDIETDLRRAYFYMNRAWRCPPIRRESQRDAMELAFRVSDRIYELERTVRAFEGRPAKRQRK